MWDERYNTAEYLYGITANTFLVSMAGHIPKGRVLCLAEGEGRNAVFLATLGHEVVAVDSSAVGLKKASRLAAERKVDLTIVVANLDHVQIEPAHWDGIVSIFCHIDPLIRVKLHRACVQGLRPDGVLILEAYTPSQLRYGTGGPPREDMMMSLDLLNRELEGLNFLHALELEREIIEGRLHTGRGAVVQVVAKKTALPGRMPSPLSCG